MILVFVSQQWWKFLLEKTYRQTKMVRIEVSYPFGGDHYESSSCLTKFFILCPSIHHSFIHPKSIYKPATKQKFFLLFRYHFLSIERNISFSMTLTPDLKYFINYYTNIFWHSLMIQYIQYVLWETLWFPRACSWNSDTQVRAQVHFSDV